jgi:hypothetical protein
MVNKKENILNGIEGCLQSKIDTRLFKSLRKELEKECEDFINKLKRDYPDLKDFIDSVGFDIEVKVKAPLDK